MSRESGMVKRHSLKAPINRARVFRAAFTSLPRASGLDLVLERSSERNRRCLGRLMAKIPELQIEFVLLDRCGHTESH